MRFLFSALTGGQGDTLRAHPPGASAASVDLGVFESSLLVERLHACGSRVLRMWSSYTCTGVPDLREDYDKTQPEVGRGVGAGWVTAGRKVPLSIHRCHSQG